MAPKRLIAGKITGVHGVRGEFRLRTYTESLDWFSPGRRIWIEADLSSADRSSEEDTPADSYEILSSRPHKGGLLVFLVEVTDRTEAEALIGSEVSIPADELPELDEDDTWYWKDLIGMTVREDSGHLLGTLTQIMETGGNDVYVVTDNGKEILIPALASVVQEVDVAGKRMIVCLPEGL